MTAYYRTTTDIVAALRRVADQIEQDAGADPSLPAMVGMEVLLQVTGTKTDNATRIAVVDRLARALDLPTETYETSSGPWHHGVGSQYRFRGELPATVFTGLKSEPPVTPSRSSGVTT